MSLNVTVIRDGIVTLISHITSQSITEESVTCVNVMSAAADSYGAPRSTSSGRRFVSIAHDI